MTDTKKVKVSAARKKPPAAGMGRPKGAVNKTTRQVKEMILQALETKGGADYLARQADENPAAFMTLIGKVLPLQLTGENGGPIEVKNIMERVAERGARLRDEVQEDGGGDAEGS